MNTVTDVQIEEIRSASELGSARRMGGRPQWQAIDTLPDALTERDATIAVLKETGQRIDDQLMAADKEIAELRKPVAVEADPGVEYLRRIRADLSRWAPQVDGKAVTDCLFDAYDALAKNHACMQAGISQSALLKDLNDKCINVVVAQLRAYGRPEYESIQVGVRELIENAATDANARDAANAEIEGLRRKLQDSRDELSGILGYLKEGESPAQCIARNREDVGRALGYLSKVTAERDAALERERQLRELLQEIADKDLAAEDELRGLGLALPEVSEVRKKIAVLLAATPSPASVETFQKRVDDWMQRCFGPEISNDRQERSHRFLEESLELVQAAGCTQHEALELVAYVYGRPRGVLDQEIGGVVVTLHALCLAWGKQVDSCGEAELQRVWGLIERIRAKHAAKPKFSPLPSAPVESERERWTMEAYHLLGYLSEMYGQFISPADVAKLAQMRSALATRQQPNVVGALNGLAAAVQGER